MPRRSTCSSRMSKHTSSLSQTIPCSSTERCVCAGTAIRAASLGFRLGDPPEGPRGTLQGILRGIPQAAARRLGIRETTDARTACALQDRIINPPRNACLPRVVRMFTIKFSVMFLGTYGYSKNISRRSEAFTASRSRLPQVREGSSRVW